MQTPEEVLFDNIPTEHYLPDLDKYYVPAMWELANQQSIDFGRWLLANAEVKLDSGGLWIWNYAGKDINTDEIFEIYLKENE